MPLMNFRVAPTSAGIPVLGRTLEVDPTDGGAHIKDAYERLLEEGEPVLVLATVSFPYARKEGIGGMFRAGLGQMQVIMATLLMLVIIGVFGQPATGIICISGIIL